MTNLDRLKGTPYLIDGLESFLRHWFTPDEPNTEPLDWTDEQMTVLNALPESAREFYRLAHRWPQTWKPSSVAGRLTIPPQVARWGQSESGEPVIEEIQFAKDDYNGTLIASLRHGDVPVPQNFQRGPDWPDSYVLIPISASLEEVLVSMILRSTILQGTTTAYDEKDLSETTCIFTGRWFRDQPIDFYYHPDHLLIYDLGVGDSRHLISAFQPQRVCYYFE